MTRILTHRFSAFGDVAMMVPVLQEFLEQNEDVEVIVVSKKNFSALFEGIPKLIFHGIDFSEYDGFLGMIRLSNLLITRYQPNFIADLHDVIRTKILTRIFKFKGYPVFIIDKGKEEKEELTDVWNLDKKQLKSTTERYADVFRAMGFHVDLSHQLRPKHVHKEGIGYAPFAQHKGKMLPLDKSFEAVKLLSQFSKVYFFGGGKEENKILDEWQRQLPNTESLAGKLALSEELEKIASLKLMVSMDSANMHLASLVGTRCISVWGATHPYAGFLGYGQSQKDVVQVKDLTCRPCSVFGDKPCYRDDWACLEEIQVKTLVDKVALDFK